MKCLALVFLYNRPYVRVPVGVKHGGSVPAEERDLVGSPPALVDGDDGKSASTAGFPVHGNVFGVCLGGMSASFARSRARQADLDQVGIPSVLGDTQVIVALLLGGC
jgi:hypothetical protein